MNYDIKDIPFSRRGSYFAVSFLSKQQAMFIRDVHGGDESPSELFELIVEGHSDLSSETFQAQYVVEATETLFKISRRCNQSDYVAIILPTAEQLRIKVAGLTVTLKAHKGRYDSLNQLNSTTYEYISYKKETKYQLQLTWSHIQVDAPWYRVGNPKVSFRLDGRQEVQELIMTNYHVVFKEPDDTLPTFERAHQLVVQEYQAWLNSSLKVPEKYQKGQAMANYIIWSSIVRPVGQLTRESVYMSKNWMQNIWSWDNCFNAMGVAASHPELAFNQFQVFIDHQDESGVYPDFINDKYVSYNCCKPPIHAWAYEQLIAVHPYFSQPEQLSVIYDSLVATTNFWLTHRLSDQGLPYYTHGNDSGWDNASLFHQGLPVVSPDLSAYLIQQLDILGKWSKQLGRKDNQDWQRLGDQLTKRLLEDLYDGQQFIARSYRTGEAIDERGSLLLCLPLVIGYRLPESIQSRLIEQITTQFEGPFGLQTETKSSPHYQVDGYWLGPIWAPESFIFFDAFRRNGQTEIAKRLAQKYCQLANEHGMAENYNPETGEGNDDLSFTWTSSVFLLLGNYLKEWAND